MITTLATLAAAAGFALVLAGVDYAAIDAILHTHYTTGGLLAAIGACVIADAAVVGLIAWLRGH